MFQNHNFAKNFYRQSFVLYGITAHILQAALHVLGTSNIDGTPDEKVISSPDTLWTALQ